ncbi:hypothetical protein HK405_013925, partial [Cladochytrium tenue]
AFVHLTGSMGSLKELGTSCWCSNWLHIPAKMVLEVADADETIFHAVSGDDSLVQHDILAEFLDAIKPHARCRMIRARTLAVSATKTT